MKIRSYKEYKSNGFCLNYYTRIINDYGVQRTIVIAYCDGRRMKDFAGEEKYALRSIICRLADEQRAAETEAYIKEQAARMGVSEYIVKAHIEEVQRKNMKATVPAEKPEITAEDIALYDYALGGAPVEGYTITCAETILKSMKKAGITPAAVERARKKINKEKKAAAPAPVVEAPAPVVEVPAPAEPLPGWCKDNTKVLNTLYNSIGTIKDFTYNKVLECWQCTFVNTATGTEYKKHSISYMKPIEEAPAAEMPTPPAVVYVSEPCPPTPTDTAATVTDAEVMETAARIRANYEAMQADIDAEREQAAAAFAEAITAYCEELEQPEPLAWEPETIIIPFEPMPAAEVEQPRLRHRLNLRPRLSRWLHPVRWVAVVFVVCLLSGLLLGMNTSTATDAAADDIAAVYELHPVIVTAEAPDTFIEDKAPRLIEDKAPAPSTVKKMADAAECSSQKTDTADTPAGEKTASPMNTASDPHGLTICEGTPWAYTMMNWA